MSAGEEFNRLMKMFDRIDQQIYEKTVKWYEVMLKGLTEDELEYEFNQVNLPITGEYQRLMDNYGREFMESYLVDAYDSNQYRKMVAA